MYDAINILIRAFDLLLTRRHVDFNQKISCIERYDSLPWLNGRALVNAFKEVYLKSKISLYLKHSK